MGATSRALVFMAQAPCRQREASWPGSPADSRNTLCSGGGNSSLQCQGCLHLMQVQVCNQASGLHALKAHVKGSYNKQQASLQDS